MRKKGILLTFGGLVAVLVLGAGATEAQTRAARPGQPPRSDVPRVSKAGGVNCAGATVATPTAGVYSYSDSGNSCNGTNTISDYRNAGTGGPCNTLLYPGPELIYAFAVGVNNNITVRITPTAPADLGVFVLSDCTNGLSCEGYADIVGGGSIGTLMLGNQGLAAGTYWVYVDSYYATGAASCGAYTLQITGDAPVELMDFKVE